MRLFFYSSAGPEDKNAEAIAKYLRQVGATMINENSSKKIVGNFESSMEKVDALVIYGLSLDAQAGYWLAWAIAKNKDVLCLLPAGVKIDAALERLQQDQRSGKNLRIEHFQGQEALLKVANFLEALGQENLQEVYNIKYTLRLSRKINEFLEWKNKESGVDKATWLRQQIQNLMDQDANFKKYLDNKFKIK